jgi:YidC/Oxa1 family membrane protein insertase
MAEQGEGSTDDAPVATTRGDGFDAIAGGVGNLTREQALARSERVEVRTPSLSGSIALTGARFDDIQLVQYDRELDSEDPVTLLSPSGSEYGHFIASGWVGQNDTLPGLSTDWTLVEGNVLTPESPIVLETRTGALTFQRRISVDENYLFTVEETVTNSGSEDVSLQPYGVVRHEDFPVLDSNQFILHEGAVGATGNVSFDRKFNWLEGERDREEVREGEGGWVGLTTKYWLAAITPDQSENVRAQFRTLPRDELVFEANYLTDPIAVAAGASITRTTHIFTGAKDQPQLVAYKNELGIQRLDSAVDWGMFWFLTQPFFISLHWLYGVLGNYGLAIMVLTLGIKLVLFPLNNRAFASMAKMRAVAPKMQEIRERNKDNPQAQQQAMMELYRKEKINPVAGCLPILPQIPIFFALYKTVFISLDARHAPFFGWIQDMSAPDPTSMWNLFGLLPYDPAGLPILGGVLAIGVWPLIMGVSMWAQQSLNPPPPDKIQRQIFAFLPIVFTIVLAPFAAALVIYWTWNNILTVAQQYYIMRRQGVTTELDKNALRLMAKIKGKPAPVFEDPNAPNKVGATLEEKASAATGAVLTDGAAKDGEVIEGEAKAVEPKADGDAEAKPKPAGKRTSSNPAAKKKRSSPKKKK